MDSEEKTQIAYVAIGVFIVALFGMIWTKHRRATHKDVNADDMINKINSERVEGERRAQQRYVEESRERARAAGAGNPAVWTPKYPDFPSDLDEQTAKSAIETCGFFREPVTVMLPKQFRANLYDLATHQYPALPIAIREGLVQLSPPFDPNNDSGDPRRMITVVVPSLSTSEVGDDYRVDLGYRRVDTVHATTVRPDTVNVAITWSVQASNAADLAPEGQSRNSGATLQKVDNAWRASFRGVTCQ